MDSVDVNGFDCLLGLPPGEDPVAAVIVIHEAWGRNADIRAIGGRFVEAGYATLVPDMYSAGFKPLCIARTVADVFRHDAIEAAASVDGMRAWLATQPGIRGDRVGVIGFCLGGAIAVMSAATGDFQAASVNYGEVPTDTAKLEDICPVVGSYGRLDTRLLDSADRLRQVLAEQGVPHDIEVYEGAGHSFLNDAMPEVLTKRIASIGYAPDQAEDAWRRILAFFDQHL